MSHPALATPRLLLEPLSTRDQAVLQALFSDPLVMTFSDGVLDEGGVRAWIEARQGRGDRVWMIRTRAGEHRLGYCGLFHLDAVNGRPEVEIGYRLLPAGWGHGYATEAAQAVRDHALRDLGLRRLIALIDPANTRSRRVAERLGMRPDGQVLLPGYTHPDLVYALSA